MSPPYCDAATRVRRVATSEQNLAENLVYFVGGFFGTRAHVPDDGTLPWRVGVNLAQNHGAGRERQIERGGGILHVGGETVVFAHHAEHDDRLGDPGPDVLGLAQHFRGCCQCPNLQHARLAWHDGEIGSKQKRPPRSASLPGPSATTKSVSSSSTGSSFRISLALLRRTSFMLGTASRIHCDEDSWASQSAKVTRCPCSCSQAARWTESVDFPTPPLLFATTIIMH